MICDFSCQASSFEQFGFIFGILQIFLPYNAQGKGRASCTVCFTDEQRNTTFRNKKCIGHIQPRNAVGFKVIVIVDKLLL